MLHAALRRPSLSAPTTETQLTAVHYTIFPYDEHDHPVLHSKSSKSCTHSPASMGYPSMYALYRRNPNTNCTSPSKVNLPTSGTLLALMCSTLRNCALHDIHRPTTLTPFWTQYKINMALHQPYCFQYSLTEYIISQSFVLFALLRSFGFCACLKRRTLH